MKCSNIDFKSQGQLLGKHLSAEQFFSIFVRALHYLPLSACRKNEAKFLFACVKYSFQEFAHICFVFLASVKRCWSKFRYFFNVSLSASTYQFFYVFFVAFHKSSSHCLKKHFRQKSHVAKNPSMPFVAKTVSIIDYQGRVPARLKVVSVQIQSVK